jgi:hypothetical protein
MGRTTYADWRRGRHLVGPACLLWAWQSMAGQGSNARIRERLANPAPLGADEITQVLDAARAAAAQRTFWVSSSFAGTPSLELLLGSDGRPVLIKVTSGIDTSGAAQPARHVTVEVLTHYLRQPAVYCDGSSAPGELVAEYENVGDGWTVSMRHSVDGSGELTPISAALRGEVALVDAGALTIAGRVARGLKAPWNPREPGGAIAPDAAQTLWLDVESLLPLRWSVTMAVTAGATPVDYGFFLVPDDTIELRIPAGVRPPRCISR